MRRALLLLRLLGGFAALLAAAAQDAVGCGVPTRLSFAELRNEYKNQNYFSVGKTAKYMCRPGYGRVPLQQPAITCLENGRWSEALEFCKKKLCGHPGEPENGRVIITDIQFGSTVHFACEEGHQLIGQPYRRCEIYGTRVAWSGEVPICELGCGVPTRLSFAELRNEYKNQNYFSVGKTAKYMCRPGYGRVPLQQPAITCLENGRWSEALEFCKKKLCGHPGEPENGRVIITDIQFGSTVHFACEEGHQLIGQPYRRCEIYGTRVAWSGEVPICEQGCGVPTRLSFAELKSEYKNQSSFPVGKTINYTCRPGYSRHPRIQSTLTCLENRTWSEALEFCKKKSCGHPGEPENGRAIVTDILFGSTVNFTCEEGHRLIGQPYRRCEISGTRVAWSGEVPICERN